MSGILIKKDSNGKYILKDCPLEYKLPLACQAKGCPYWNGYMFIDAFWNGNKHHISGQWRKIMLGNVRVANHVRCLLKEEKELNNG